jgi:glycosyltransferase involved in cell wall biosynthesis
MNITFVLPDPSYSGGTRVVAIYARELRLRGHQVNVVVTPRKPLPFVWRFKSLIRGRIKEAKSVLKPSYLDDYDVPQIRLNRWGPIKPKDIPDADVVVATWWESSFWVRDLPESKGQKIYFMQDYGAKDQEIEQLKPTWELGIPMITISRWLQDLVLSHCPGADIQIVRNGIETVRFHAGNRAMPESPVVGTMYRKRKGWSLAVEAFELARRQIPNLKLLAYGFGRPQVIPEGAEIVSAQNDSELCEIYASSTAWLFTSDREGFGLPILESMACGTPVIAVPAGAAPELVNNSNGHAVGNHDPESIASGIVRICQLSKPDWLKLSDSSLQVAEANDWTAPVDQFECILKKQ